MRSTQQDKTVQLAPIIIQILEEILRSLEGSFNWAVIAEPSATDDIDDIFGAWDEPTADEPTMAIKCARVKMDNMKGKGPAGTMPIKGSILKGPVTAVHTQASPANSALIHIQPATDARD